MNKKGFGILVGALSLALAGLSAGVVIATLTYIKNDKHEIKGITPNNDNKFFTEDEIKSAPTLSVVQKAFNGVTKSKFDNLNAKWASEQNEKKIILEPKNDYFFDNNESKIESKLVEVLTIMTISVKVIPEPITINEWNKALNNPKNLELTFIEKFFNGITSQNLDNFKAELSTTEFKITLTVNSGFGLNIQGDKELYSKDITIPKEITITPKQNDNPVVLTISQNESVNPTSEIINLFFNITGGTFADLDISWTSKEQNIKEFNFTANPGFAFDKDGKDQLDLEASVIIQKIIEIKPIKSDDLSTEITTKENEQTKVDKNIFDKFFSVTGDFSDGYFSSEWKNGNPQEKIFTFKIKAPAPDQVDRFAFDSNGMQELTFIKKITITTQIQIITNKKHDSF